MLSILNATTKKFNSIGLIGVLIHRLAKISSKLHSINIQNDLIDRLVAQTR